MSLKSLRSLKSDPYQAKRGDTIIEVMFAIAVFCLVAVISISMMNTGVAQAEGALEVTTARNEINAQAEALRFIHSSYLAELSLPNNYMPDGRYQIYTNLWRKIVANTIEPADIEGGLTDLGSVIAGGCSKIYEGSPNLLKKNKAFVLNTRDLQTIDSSTSQVNPAIAMKEADDNFIEPPLNARLVFKRDDGTSGDSTSQFADTTFYNRIALAEGIWVFGVKGRTNPGGPVDFYDFYIQSCWYGPNSKSPQSVDTIIRLYNPEGA